MKTSFASWCVLSSTIFLSACQFIDTAKIKQISETNATQKNALIYCSGTENCEFERFNMIRIMDDDTHKVYPDAIDAKIVRLQKKHVADDNALYLSVPAGQHELVLRFYPISMDKAEKIHLIHNFKERTSYTLKMYRNRSHITTSLLKSSAPDPLCVALLQEQKVIRRFCKPYNALTGLGEFVEQKP